MRRSTPRYLRAALLAAATSLLAAGTVHAHGSVPNEPPTIGSLVFGWTIEPLVALPLLIATWAWLRMVGRVNAAHPANPVPRRRTAAFLGGLAAIAAALLSGIDRYDTTLFWVHMIQHLLLVLVAAPLLALSSPITLLLRYVSRETRQRWILPVLHSRLVRVISFPVVTWIVFAAVMWASHFSPLFDLALEDPLVHDLEHAAFLAAGLLFWWPALGRDPAPWRMSAPIRGMYVFLQMPQNTFLAVALLSAPAPLYRHYVTLERSWGPDPLVDQQLAAGIMWLGGDILFIAAILFLVVEWMRSDERDQARADRRADAQLASIRARETRLAERLAEERPAPDGS